MLDGQKAYNYKEHYNPPTNVGGCFVVLCRNTTFQEDHTEMEMSFWWISSSLAALEVVILTTSVAGSVDNFDIKIFHVVHPCLHDLKTTQGAHTLLGDFTENECSNL